jgi:uncharacterized low-complexity protein
MIRIATAGALAMALAAPASAQNAASAYTELDLGRCRQTSAVEEGESATWTCPGLGGRAVYVSTGDGRFDVDVGRDDGDFETAPPFNSIGPRIEWRLRGGRPVAIVYRLTLAASEQPIPSALAVKAVGADGRSGCLAALVRGDLADANARARRIADTARRFRCGVERTRHVWFRW